MCGKIYQHLQTCCSRFSPVKNEQFKGFYAQPLGSAGEAIAARYLSKDGYQMLARNWLASRGELDLIVKSRFTLVFCEVKTRSDPESALQHAYRAINAAKLDSIRQASLDYLQRRSLELRKLALVRVRFDLLVAIPGSRNKLGLRAWKVLHKPGAFWPNLHSRKIIDLIQ